MATARKIVIEKLRNHTTEIDKNMQKHFKLNKQNLDTTIMKLKFVRDFEGPIDSAKISLYLHCPTCENVWQYHGYPSNPVLSTVYCTHCGHNGMGASFKKAVIKKKQKPLTMKEKREIIGKYVLMPEDPDHELGGFIPWDASSEHSSIVKVQITNKLVSILRDDKPLCRMLKIIYEQEKELLPHTRQQLIDVIGSSGSTQKLIKKATYFGLLERKIKDNILRNKPELMDEYYTLTNQGKKILKVAEIMDYTD